MITLNVKDYCQTCSEFDFKVSEKNTLLSNFTKEYTIYCGNARRCANIEKHLKEVQKNGGNSNEAAGCD